MTVSVPPPLAEASVPADDAALVVEPVMAEATVPGTMGAGVVEVNVPKADALSPQRMPSWALVVVLV
jgi:hypothetical protein